MITKAADQSNNILNSRILGMGLDQALITATAITILLSATLLCAYVDPLTLELPIALGSAAVMTMVGSLLYAHYQKVNNCLSYVQTEIITGCKKIDLDERVAGMTLRQCLITVIAVSVLFALAFVCNSFDIGGYEVPLFFASSALAILVGSFSWAKYKQQQTLLPVAKRLEERRPSESHENEEEPGAQKEGSQQAKVVSRLLQTNSTP